MCFRRQELGCVSRDLCLLSLLALQLHIFTYLLRFTILSFTVLFHQYIIFMIITLKAGRNITVLVCLSSFGVTIILTEFKFPLASTPLVLFFFLLWQFFFFFLPSLPSWRHSGTPCCSVVKSYLSYGPPLSFTLSLSLLKFMSKAHLRVSFILFTCLPSLPNKLYYF